MEVRPTDIRVLKSGAGELAADGVAAALVVCMFEPSHKLGGLLHALLPECPTATDDTPGRFLDTGIAALVDMMVASGADRRRLSAGIAGGAEVFSFADDATGYSIGVQNVETARAVLEQMRIPIRAESIGGSMPRKVTLNVQSGAAASGRPGRKPEPFGVLRPKPAQAAKEPTDAETGDDAAPKAEEPVAGKGRTMSEEIARKIADDIKELPQLPGVVQRVLAITDDPSTSAQDLGQVLGTDQALTVRVLRMANSPLFGLMRRVDTVTRAVAVLGFDAIRNLVLASHLATTMSKEVEGYDLGQGQLWRHALASGTAAMVLAKRARFPEPERALVAGVLQDVGKLVLGTYMGKQLAGMVDKAVATKISFVDIEKTSLGVNHAEVGALVTESWGLPEELTNVVRYHHKPGLHPSGAHLVWLAHLGDYLAMTGGFGLGGEGLAYQVDARGWAKLGIDPSQLPAVMKEVTQKVQALEKLLEGE